MVAPPDEPSCPEPVPGVPHFGGLEPVVVDDVMFVNLVQGDQTVILLLLRYLTTVGPV